tara:strand:- start:2121 stop:3092 length:972 start_codon:yes stop_codon:yes gene_type:complete
MATLTATRQYTLSDFKNKEDSGNIPELENLVIEKINKLATRVGAPTYQKTPVFKRYSYNKKKKVNENISSADWETIRNFKTTTLDKNMEGLEAQMDQIRSYLNKLTIENYSEISNEIKMVIKEIVDQNEEQYLSKIGVSIFEIGSANRFLSKVYVKLYKELIDTYPIMKNVCTSNFNSFQSLFETFDYCDASEDYDKFCDITKQNEKRKALSKFLMICVEYNIIELESMEKIILDFLNKINEYIESKEKENAVDEIVANLAIMILSSVSVFKKMNSHNKIFKDIEILSGLNVKKYPGLSNKTLFKFLDIMDELEEEDSSSDDE